MYLLSSRWELFIPSNRSTIHYDGILHSKNKMYIYNFIGSAPDEWVIMGQILFSAKQTNNKTNIDIITCNKLLREFITLSLCCRVHRLMPQSEMQVDFSLSTKECPLCFFLQLQNPSYFFTQAVHWFYRVMYNMLDNQFLRRNDMLRLL